MNRGSRRRGEAGALLIAVMVGVAVASIALAVAVQAWSTVWRRDSEQELIFRGTQYVNAILAYQKEHGGQYPLNLEELYKPGPRRVRYIRKLFRDPIAKDGKWGLLYLMPGGRGVYDPKAAQKAQEKAAQSGWGDGDGSSADPNAPPAGAPGFAPFNTDPLGTGVPGTAGPAPGALPPGVAPPPPGSGQPAGSFDGPQVSEPPIGWPIVGVISRASGKVADNTFGTYKGHDKIDEWQFQVFDQGGQPLQVPGNPGGAPAPFPGVGPGIGGHSAFTGLGGGATPGMNPRMFPGQGQGGYGGMGQGGFGNNPPGNLYPGSRMPNPNNPNQP